MKISAKVISAYIFHQERSVISCALIQGTTLKNGEPISCHVHAYSRRSGKLLSQTTSKPNGQYILLGSQISENFVVALDPENKYNVAARDNVT